MNSSFRAHGQGHRKGDSAAHPIEPRWRLLAALLLLALRNPQRSALQAAVKPEACLLRAVQVCAGTPGAAALSLASALHRNPLGRVQLRFPG